MKQTASVTLWVLLLFLCSQKAFAQAGKDGAEIISTSGVVFNRYDVLSASIVAGSNTAVVSNIANLAGGAAGANNPYATSALGYGDLIMIIKMQGAGINTTNTSSYGSVTSLNGVGTYELAVVRGITGNTITICNTFANSYTVSSTERVQVIRVPRLTDLTVNSGASLTANAWTGSTGGIVAVEVNGNAVVDGSVTTTALGYRGGALDNNASLPGNPNYVSTASTDGGEKGEGIAGHQTDYDALGGRYNRGAPANGGGGGNAHNGGGGGGANAGSIGLWNGNGNPDNSGAGWSTAWNQEAASFSSNTSSGGGRGGYTYGSNNADATTTPPGNTGWGGDNRQNFGGIGGRPLTYSANTLFMGGGGGAGDANNSSGGAGGNGGGIIYLLVTGNLSGTGSITANGANGGNSTATFNDAPGGGGGGGAIRLNVQGTISSITVNANGGNGGSQPITSAESEGPGGGGAGGFVSVPGTPAITVTVTGGNNGTTNSSSLTEFTPNGATKGDAGTYLTGQAFVAAPPLACFPLPLNFVSFTATWQDNKVLVNWSTADEINVDHFEVQVSSNQQQWITVIQKPALNRSSLIQYNCLIDALSALFYVRIKSVDAGGSYQYSSIRVVRVQLSPVTLSVNGNTLQLNQLPFNVREMKVYGSNGQLYKKQALTPVANSVSFDIGSLPEGVYYLQLQTDSETQGLKFIKR